jgi:hypothetical protein
MNSSTQWRGFLATAALLGTMAGCANASAPGDVPSEPCKEGATQACYSGPPGTLGVASCKGGERRCVGGTWSPCEGESAPIFEICNGEDDDCDGVADNGNPDGGSTCATGQKGLCGLGTMTCKDGALQCIAPATPTDEVCDALDNDCDGEVDEEVVESGEACATGVPGACSAGKYKCTGGALVCALSTFPSPETCNGIDEDCDGVVDNDANDVGQACSTGLKGLCGTGATACVNSVVKCMPPDPMAVETCDGVDQNCDGILDDDVCATVRLEAVADSTLNLYNAENNGSSDVLHVYPGDYDTFIRFDLKSVPSNAKLLFVRLEITGLNGIKEPDDTVNASLVQDDKWLEDETTLIHPPASESDPCGVWVISDSWEGYTRLLVSDPLLLPPVEEALESDKLISFRIHSDGYWISFYSREWDIAAQRPQLVVQYEVKP